MGLDPSMLAALKDSSADDRAKRAAKRNEGQVDDGFLSTLPKNWKFAKRKGKSLLRKFRHYQAHASVLNRGRRLTWTLKNEVLQLLLWS